MKKLALHWQIILGMVFGIFFALILTNFPWGPQFIGDWIKPFGTIFINALKLIAVPLILGSLIKGISYFKAIKNGHANHCTLYNNHGNSCFNWFNNR